MFEIEYDEFFVDVVFVGEKVWMLFVVIELGLEGVKCVIGFLEEIDCICEVIVLFGGEVVY